MISSRSDPGFEHVDTLSRRVSSVADPPRIGWEGFRTDRVVTTGSGPTGGHPGCYQRVQLGTVGTHIGLVCTVNGCQLSPNNDMFVLFCSS